MSNFLLNHISNSRAANEPFNNTFRYEAPFAALSQFLIGAQSPSVTSNGLLWQQMLAHMAFDNPPILPENDLDKMGFSQNIEQIQKNEALIQLLRSWREGDEQEQRETWEYLKRALDEDRISDRELFP